jgi:hypothetical protein
MSCSAPSCSALSPMTKSRFAGAIPLTTTNRRTNRSKIIDYLNHTISSLVIFGFGLGAVFYSPFWSECAREVATICLTLR